MISPNRYPQGEVLSYARRQNGTCKVTPNAGGGFSSLRAFPFHEEVENPHEVEIPLQKGSLAEQQSVLWSFIALSP